jgi:hypothetical protein
MEAHIFCRRCYQKLTEGPSALHGSDWTRQIRLWSCTNRECSHCEVLVIGGLTATDVAGIRKGGL